MNKEEKEKQEELELLQKISMAKSLADDWQAPIKHRRDLYHFKHYVGKGNPRDGETRYSDPTYTNAVDLAVGILQSNDFRWHVYGWSPSSADTADSSAIEKYLAGTIHANSLREEEDIRLEITQSFVRDGVAVLYSVWDTKLAKRYLTTIDEIDPEAELTSENSTLSKKTKLYKETPIIMKVINPLNVYMLPGGPNRWQAVMRVEDMSILDIENNFDVKLSDYSNLSVVDKMSNTEQYIDYWELRETEAGIPEVWNAKVAGSQVLKLPVKMSGYEYLPYTIAFYTNDMSDSPKNWVKGLTDVLENSVSMLETGINRRQNMIDRFTGLPILVTTKPGRTVVLDNAMNATKIEEGERVEFPKWPGTAPDVDAQLEFFRNRIQQSGFSESLYGSAQGHSGSGYAISQESDQNRIRLTQPVANLQLFWTQWARKILSMTENFAKKSKVRVYGRVKNMDFSTMVPGQDLTSFIVECAIKPDFPQERTRKHAMATQAKGVLSDETLMQEYYDIEQPDEEKKRKLIELAQAHPAAQQYAIMLNLMEMSKAGDEAATMALDIVKSEIAMSKAKQQSQGNPEQAAGLASATGALTPQEQGQPPAGQGETAQMKRQVTASPNMNGGI